MNLSEAMRDWAALSPELTVLDGERAQLRYGSDTSGAVRRIAGAVLVRTREQVPDIVRVASRYGVRLWPISTGRNWGYGTALPVCDDCVVIDLSGLQQILGFDAELGVVTVEPGVTQGMLAEFLETGNHPFMVPVTGAGPNCSIVGNALERGYGITPYADHWGAVTDLEAVLADGEVFRSAMHEAGGLDLARLYRWGIGPNLNGLFSQGAFGIVTSASVLLDRRPDCVKLCLFSLRDDEALASSVAAVRTIIGNLKNIVGGVNLMNRHRMLAMATQYPKDRVGSNSLIPTHVIEELAREYHLAPWTGLATLYGSRQLVRVAQAEIRTQLSRIKVRPTFVTPRHATMLSHIARVFPVRGTARRLERAASTLSSALDLALGRPSEVALPLSYWRSNVTTPSRDLDPARDGCGLLWFAPLIPMRPKLVGQYVAMAKEAMVSNGFEPLITLTSLSERLFDSNVPLLFDRGDPTARERANRCHSELLDGVSKLGGFPYRVSIDGQRAIQSRYPRAREVIGRLQSAMDPNGLLAPGRYG